MRRHRHIIAVATLLAATAARADFPAADKQAAAAALEQSFGQPLRQVRATPDKADDIQTAGLLLQASNDAQYAPALQALLAQTAVDLLLPIGNDKSTPLLELALRRYINLGDLSAIERTTWLAGVRTRQLDAAKADARKPIAAALARTVEDLALTQEQAGDLDAALAQMGRAAGVAKTGQLADLAEEMAFHQERLSHTWSFRRELAAAQQELRAAQAGKNEPLERQLREKIGQLYLLRLGDCTQAWPYRQGGQSEWTAGLSCLSRRAAGQSLSVTESQDTAEMLLKVAARTDSSARAALIDTALELCDESQSAASQPAAQPLRLEALRKQAQDLQARNPNPLGLKIRAALAGLSERYVVLADGRTQFRCSFTAAGDLADWNMQVGQWQAQGGSLSVQSAKGVGVHRPRLRADRPIDITFDVATTGSVELILAMDEYLQQAVAGPRLMIQPSAKKITFTGTGDNPQPVRVIAQGPYHVEIHYDGQGKFKFTIDGQDSGSAQIPTPLPDENYRLAVQTAGAGSAISGLTVTATLAMDNPLAKATPPPPPPPANRGQRPPNRPNRPGGIPGSGARFPNGP